MRKDHVLKLFDSGAELARFLGLSRSAVHQWIDDKPIPELQQYRLRDLIPTIDNVANMSPQEIHEIRESVKLKLAQTAARDLERAQDQGQQQEDVRP